MEQGRGLPHGATYIPFFLDEATQAATVAAIDASPWNTDLRRRVQHFGYRYDYSARSVTSDAYIGPLPDWSQSIARQLVGAAWFSEVPNQLIINEYTPGQGISAHIDCVACFSDTIVSVSLLSACEMHFVERKTRNRLACVLEPLSVLVLAGPARFDWTHEIPARKSDVISGHRKKRSRRLSLTFRAVTTARTTGSLVRRPR